MPSAAASSRSRPCTPTPRITRCSPRSGRGRARSATATSCPPAPAAAGSDTRAILREPGMLAPGLGAVVQYASYLSSSGRGSAWLERLVRDQEAPGSNPGAPTKSFNNLRGIRLADDSLLVATGCHPVGLESMRTCAFCSLRADSKEPRPGEGRAHGPIPAPHIRMAGDLYR